MTRVVVCLASSTRWSEKPRGRGAEDGDGTQRMIGPPPLARKSASVHFQHCLPQRSGGGWVQFELIAARLRTTTDESDRSASLTSHTHTINNCGDKVERTFLSPFVSREWTTFIHRAVIGRASAVPWLSHGCARCARWLRSGCTLTTVEVRPKWRCRADHPIAFKKQKARQNLRDLGKGRRRVQDVILGGVPCLEIPFPFTVFGW